MTQDTRRAAHPQRRHRVALVSALLLSGAVAGGGTPRAADEVGRITDEARAKVSTAVSHFIATNRVPGVSVAIVLDGRLAWAEGFGMADVEAPAAATAHTVYRIASISKALTGTAAMVLSEQGRFDLDAPVQRYCASFPAKPWPITTRQLLGHLGGIRYYRVPEYPYSQSQSDPEVGNTRHFENGIEGGLHFFASDPLVAQPGTHFHYSTQGYTLAACAMEGAAGETYADVVRRTVLSPAGMTRTQPDDRQAIVPLRTRFYSKSSSGALMNAEFLDSSYKVAGGGWLSSAPDLAHLAVAMLSDRLVTRAARARMWTQQTPSDGLGRMGYGLGWQLGSVDGVRLVGHGGAQQGASAMMLIAPDRRAAVVVLTNADGVGASGLAVRLFRIVLGLSERRSQPASIDIPALPAYVGTYRFMEMTVRVSAHDGGLVAETGGGTVALLPAGTRRFTLESTDVDVTFVTDGRQPARELIVHEGGTDIFLSRVQ
jgi:serine beta-lactamase-like protein LACTB